MKPLRFVLFGLLLAACSNDPEGEPKPKGVEYTFNVQATDQSTFSAVISWGIDQVQYVDPVNAAQYASSFEAVPGHTFVVSVESDANLKLIFRRNSQPVKELPIEPGRVYTFDHELNF